MTHWRLISGLCLPLAVLTAAGAGRAQPSLTAEAMTDYRVRGLSWSRGRPAIGAALGAELPLGFHSEVWGATARQAVRHGGADAALDVTLGRRMGLGPLSLDTAVIGHVFPGGSGNQDFAEGRVALDGALGPVSATASASYAPRQGAIGGDLLHLRLASRVAVIGTPFTLRVQAGRTSGDTRDPRRAARVRPDAVYYDWLVGADHISGPLTLGIAYSDTDIGRTGQGGFALSDRRHSGAVLVARAAFGF